MKKSMFLFLTLLMILVTQPGCWDQKEVEELGLVLATGIESAPGGKVRVIIQNVNPAARGGGTTSTGGLTTGVASKPYINQSAEGNTVFDALRDLSRQTPRRLFFAHNQVIIIAEEFARERGMGDIVDFMERNPQIRRTTWLLVGRGDLATILDEPGRLEAVPAQRIAKIINERNLTSQYAVQRVGDFLESMDSEGSAPYTAVVERVNNTAKPEQHENRLAEGLVAEPHETIQLNGTAVFKRNKMVGWLNSKESRGLLWLKGEVMGGVIEIMQPEQKGTISVEILRSKTKIRSEITGGKIIVTADIQVDSTLTETNHFVDLSKSQTLDQLEKQMAEEIRSEINAVLTKTQREYQTDILGFGQQVHRSDPGLWNEIKGKWSELFPGVEVKTNITARINRTGMVTKPMKAVR